VNTKPFQKVSTRPLPAELADVAFLDIRDVCAAVRMCMSWVHNEVRQQRFPQPMRFGPRCSRWTSASIRQYLIDRAEAAAADTDAAPLAIARAKKASAAAQAKRAASSAGFVQ
jgi:predicted DNA-binding transcriptional regulator AlpA